DLAVCRIREIDRSETVHRDVRGKREAPGDRVGRASVLGHAERDEGTDHRVDASIRRHFPDAVVAPVDDEEVARVVEREAGGSRELRGRGRAPIAGESGRAVARYGGDDAVRRDATNSPSE